jgi:hypothetical protein
MAAVSVQSGEGKCLNHVKKDQFKINLRLRHLSLDPGEISTALDLKPTFSWKVGSRAGKIVHKWTIWHGLLAEGAGSKEYEKALKKSLLHLESRQEWLKDSFGDDGEFDVIFDLYTDLDDGKICEVSFYPELLMRLSKLNAGIQVNVWKDEKIEEITE